MIQFRRRSGGIIVARFEPNEVIVLRALVLQLSALLDGLSGTADDDPLPGLVIGGSDAPPEDPALRRLLPDAYRDDPDASKDFRRLTERGLANRKVAHLEAVAASLPDDGLVRLDAVAARSWMLALNDLRLVLAERLGVDSDDWQPLGLSEEQELMLDVYDLLEEAQSSLIAALDR